MARYRVRLVHKISPRETDTGTVELPGGAFADRKALGAALRAARFHPSPSSTLAIGAALASGESIRTFRVEGDKVIAFPRGSIWHSITLTQED